MIHGVLWEFVFYLRLKIITKDNMTAADMEGGDL